MAYYEKRCKLYLLTFTFILIIYWNYYTLDACMCALSVQSCSTPCDPIACSPPGSSVHGTLQARILGWVAISSSKGSSQPGIEPVSLASPALAGRFFNTEPPGKPMGMFMASQIFFRDTNKSCFEGSWWNIFTALNFLFLPVSFCCLSWFSTFLLQAFFKCVFIPNSSLM